MRGWFVLSSRYLKENNFLSKDQTISFGKTNYRQETQTILSGPPYHCEDKLSHKMNFEKARLTGTLVAWAIEFSAIIQGVHEV